MITQNLASIFHYDSTYKTAYLGFDSFTTDYTAWDEYYDDVSKKENIPVNTDSFAFVRSGLYNKKGQTIYIEVKTTKGALDTPFYLSINEKEFLEENENAYLYRVYEFDENSRSGLIKIISSKKFFKEL